LNPWPVFNVADIVLVVGVGLIALDILVSRRGASPQVADQGTP
jgi:lipoprotein signal peptidase